MESIERWLSVPGWEGLYEVSDQGRVRSLPRYKCSGAILKPTKTRDGCYWRVDLSRSGKAKTRLVHQLVLEAFLGPLSEGEEVCHGPGGSLDNRLSNLSYGTHSENSRDKVRDGTTLRSHEGSGAKLTWGQVSEIRRRGASEGPGIRAALAREFGLGRCAIDRILSGRTWKEPPAA